MSLALASRRAAISPAWAKNPLWRTARAVPSLDQPFADIKSLADAVTGQSLVTFTRASSGTSVGSDGVLRTAVTNLLLRSEEFDNASWAKLNNVTVTANATTAPNGFITADKIVEPASSADKLIVQPVTLIANTTYTASVYFKAADRPTILFHVRKSDYSTRFGGFFNTSTNVFAAETSGGGVLDSFTFTNVGGGWYRCSITGNIGANTAGIVTIYLANSSNNLTYTGDGTSGIYLWGAQLEQSSTVGEYIPTTSTINSAPRFDHNPTTGESLGLLVEESRTNEIRNSNSMSAVVTGSPGTLPTNWSAQTNANGWTREIVGSGSLGSLNYVDIRFYGTPTSAQFTMVFQPQGTVSAANGQAWAASVYHQLVGGSLGNVVGYPAANLWNSTLAYLGGLGLPGSIVPSATLQRYTGSATISIAGTAFINWGITFVCTAGNTYDFTIRFAGPQLELGAFSTSFIPTTGTAATRSADVASITGTAFSSWYRQDEGTVFCSFSRSALISSTSFANLWAFSDDTASERHLTYNTGSSQTIDTVITDGGVAQAVLIAPGAITANSIQAHSFAYKVNDFAAARNAGTVDVDTSGTLPSVNRLYVGANHVGVGQFSGYIRRLTYWPARLPNSTIQAITQ